MSRTYELGFVVDPRQSDDAVQEITQKYRELIEGSGAEITEVDYWGRRKLAYEINKFNEGKYVFIYITATGVVPPVPEIERLMGQDERILRFLVVRTDLDLKRAARKGKPGTPGGPPGKEQSEEQAGEAVGEAAAGGAENGS
jgi:small subunit ribosomal protein S6